MLFRLLLAQTQARVVEVGYDPQLYCGLSHSQSCGYTLYQRGIKVWVDHRAIDIKQLSPIVASLTETSRRTWLLYVPEVSSWVDQQLNWTTGDR